MNYHLKLEYENGATSHRLCALCKKDIVAHLNNILADNETLSMAQSIVIQHGNRVILRESTGIDVDQIRKRIRWPSVGAKSKVKKPVTATLYMPEEVKQWLKDNGDGKTSQGLRKLVEVAGITELENAWVDARQ